VLDEILAAGVVLDLTGDDRIMARGHLTDKIRDLIRANRVELLADLATKPRYRWRIVLPDGRALESCFLPEATRAEVAAEFPGAAVTPLPDSTDERTEAAHG